MKGKKNRDLILEYLEQKLVNHDAGASTSQIAEDLMMQRTNVSKLLNLLNKEGYVEKDDKNYPVVYKRTQYNLKGEEKTPFEDLVGYDGSLKRAIHLAKGAILYPNKSLDVLLVGKAGSGKSLFARSMLAFAKENRVFPEDTPKIKLNCIHYKDDKEKLNQKFKSCISESKNGFLFIDNCQYLDAESRNQLSVILDTGYTESNCSPMIVCGMTPIASNDIFFESFTSKFSITIQLPDLKDRGMKERFGLIERFFCTESLKSSCSICVNSEVLIALLLYPCENIKILFHDITQACASAYSRELDNESNVIHVLLIDFNHHVRSGLLNYKNSINEVDSIIQGESEYMFNAKTSLVQDSGFKSNHSIYDWINAKKNELDKRGLSLSEINTIVNVGIEAELNKYRNDLIKNTVDHGTLSQIVDAKIINLVDELMAEASSSLKRYFTSSIHYGLCLHVQALVEKRVLASPIKVKKMMDFIENNKAEYSLANAFCDKLSSIYKIEFPIDEVVLIAMFLCDRTEQELQGNHPSLLIAMHGTGTASTLAKTIQILNDTMVYSYDLPLNEKPLDAYDNIKQTILNIPNKNGVLVIYDMGSLKDIFNMISIETGINIRMIEMPITLLLMDCSRKMLVSKDVDEAYESLKNRFKSINTSMGYETLKKTKAIVSFCMTGEGGAMQIKKYLEKNFDLRGVEVIPVQLAEQSQFLQSLNELSKEKEILCMIGTFDPHIYGIPFISIEHIFNSSDIKELLDEDSIEKKEFYRDSEIIFEHLSKDLKHIDIIKIKPLLYDFIANVESDLNTTVELNEKIGLIVHILCMMDRIKCNEPVNVNPNADKIIKENMLLYRIITKNLIVIEKELEMNIPKGELCNIIYIIQRIKNIDFSKDIDR